MFNKVFNLFILKIVGAVLGLIYSFLLVYYFGKSRSIEIFFVSSSLLYMITSLTQSGQLSEIFLPEYTRLKSYFGKTVADQAFSVVINRLLIWMSIIAVLFFITADLWALVMAPGFKKEEQEILAVMFRVMLIQFVLTIINSFITTLLNAEKIYGKAETAGALNSIISIASLIVLYPYLGIWTLVFSLLLGRIIEFSFSVYLLRKTDFKYSWILRVNEFDHSSFFKVIKSTFLYVGATQGYYVVFTSMTTLLAPGTYAIFSHVQNIINKIQGILLGPISTVFFSEFSNRTHSTVKEEQHSSGIFFEKTLTQTLILIFSFVAITGPLTYPILKVLMYSKKMTDADIQYAALLMLVFMIGIIFSSIGGLFRKVLISKGYSKKVYLYWTGVQLFSCLFSYLMFTAFRESALFFINPINIFLLNLTSLLMYFSVISVSLQLDYKLIARLIAVSVLNFVVLYLFNHYLEQYVNFWMVLSILFPLGILFQVILLKVTGIMDLWIKAKSLLRLT